MNIRSQSEGCLFSILGDSISTLAGYTTPDGAAFYEGDKRHKAGIFTPEDTWWGQVVAAMGGRVLVNHSVSGSTVTRLRGYTAPFYSASEERTAALGYEGLSPDVIMIFMGTNDWGHGVRITPMERAQESDLAVFSVAYRTMLARLRHRYPHAALWCLTLPVSTRRRCEEFEFPYYYGGRHLEEYNEAIRAAAAAHGARVVELFFPSEPHDTIDGFHPSAEGMRTIAAHILAQCCPKGEGK